jgi:hypothetical protein
VPATLEDWTPVQAVLACPTSWCWTREVNQLTGRQIPLLGKGGVAAPSSQWSLPLKGAAGVVRSTSDNWWLERTTPSAPAKEALRLFLNGRSHPSFAKEGSSPSAKAGQEKIVRRSNAYV